MQRAGGNARGASGPGALPRRSVASQGLLRRLCPLASATLVSLLAWATAAQASDEPARPDAAADPIAAAPVIPGSGPAPSIVLAPIPQSDPTLGSGVALVGLYLYQPEGSTRPWTTGAGALYTDSRSWALAVFQKASFSDDALRMTAIAGVGEFNVDFYGVGGDAASRGRSVQLNQRSAALLGQALYRMGPDLYFGPRLQVVSLRSRLTTPAIPGLGIDPADLELHGVSSSLGASGEYDTRDSEYGPRSGLYVTGQWMFAAPALGSDFRYSKAQAALNSYHPIGDQAVLAARGYVCSASDDTPFFDLCLFGAHNDLRGYAGGQYRDRAMFATQVEYRRRLFWKVGGVAFAGVGGVAPDFSGWDHAAILPAAGLGLRFEASREYRLNFSIDAAVGSGSSGIYLYLGEAF